MHGPRLESRVVWAGTLPASHYRIRAALLTHRLPIVFFDMNQPGIHVRKILVRTACSL